MTSRIIKITRMTFAELYDSQILICSGILLLHVLISVAVIRLVNTPGPAGTGDFIALITIPILTIVFFSPGFKYVLSQGISRKTYFLAASLDIALLAAVLAVIVTIFYAISLKVANVWMIYKLLYRNENLLSVVIWEFGALFFLGMLGWFIRLVYYVSNRTAKYTVSIAPFVVAALFVLFNAMVDGRMGRAIWDFLKTVMGFSYVNPAPHIGMATMLAAAVILGGPVFLLLRRAQINE
jgi:hypothetical protein